MEVHSVAMEHGDRMYSHNDIILHDTIVRKNGRIIDISIRSIGGSPNADYANIYVPGILAKRRYYNPNAIQQTLETGMTTATFSHESGSQLCPGEVAEVVKLVTDAVGSAPTLTVHSLGGIHGTEAVTDHNAEVGGMRYMQSAGFGGGRPWRALESLRREALEWWQFMDHAQVALDGISYAMRGARYLPALAFKASTHSIAQDAHELNRIIPVRGLLFNEDPLILSDVVAQSFDAGGIQYERMGGSHLANYGNKVKVVSSAIGRACLDMLEPELKMAS